MKPPLAPTADLGQLEAGGADDRPVPGLVAVYAAGAPVCVALRLDERTKMIALGRELLADAGADDDAVSRAHASVAFDGRRWTVHDGGSRNGTFVDGARVTERVSEKPPVLRLGRAILVATEDVRGFAMASTAETVVGPRLRSAYDEIDRAASGGRALHLVGESGSGKELAARRFHERGPRASGPFVAVNCAAIPEGVAERLLFGTVRGAYSGAEANAEGYVQAADHGTLFLDEIAELDLGVQAKLLRVLESREVMALGAARPRTVEFGLCSATHKDLRACVADGHFRDDLYFRIGRPDVRLPPLRQRREEVPWHVCRTAGARDPAIRVDAAVVEACMLRHWPGNVRELVAEVDVAVQRALARGQHSVSVKDLAEQAGQPITRPSAPSEPKSDAMLPPDRVAIEAALRAHRGNVTAAARALGMHRNQLRRWVEREAVDPQAFSSDDADSADSPKGR